MESLRIALNLANTELVTGHDPDGSPTGPAPEMARRVAAAVDRTHAYFQELNDALRLGGPWIM